MKTNKFIKLGMFGIGIIIGCIGCKSIPSTEVMYASSCAIGVATGMVVNETAMDDKTRVTVVQIVQLVSQSVPDTNQTFAVAWSPIAQDHIAKLVSDGKITEEQGKIVSKVFDVVVLGIDYIFEVRYPKAKTYKELVGAVADGFTDGFLAAFTVDGTKRGIGEVLMLDVEAYKWIKARSK